MGVYVTPQVPNVNISNTINSMKSTAQSALSAVSAALNSSSETIHSSGLYGDFSYTPVDVTFEKPTKPAAPTFNASGIQQPPTPGFRPPTVDTTGIDTSGAPTNLLAIDALPLPPGLNFPAVPSPMTDAVPSAPTINTFSVPNADISDIGELPDLTTINIPTAPNIVIPQFTINYPTGNIPSPELSYQIQDYAYSTYLDLLGDGHLLSDITTRLRSNLGANSTGFDPAVEQAIYTRGQDREIKDNVLAFDTLNETEAAMGWTRPNGAALAALQSVVQQTQQRNAELSREIMINQAKLEQDNMRFSISQAIQLESSLLSLHLQQANLAFEQAKYVQDLIIEVFKLRVLKFETEANVYVAYVSAYGELVRGKLAEAEVYRARIDGEKAKADVNESTVRAYIAKAEAVRTQAQVYETLVNGVNAKIKGEELKLNSFKTQMDGHLAKVQAKNSEYNGYAEAVRGELAKAQVYDSNVKAYSAKNTARSEFYKNEVSAYAAKIEARARDADVKLKSVDSQTKVEELRLEDTKMRLEAYAKALDAEQKAYANLVDVYKGQSEIYSSEGRIAESKATAEIKRVQQNIEQNKYASDVSMANAEITLKKINFTEAMRIKTKETEATIQAGIASSALSSINVAEHSSISSSYGLSESHSFDESQ